jgi:hypothetical protein
MEPEKMRFNSGTEVSVSAAGAHQDEADTPVHRLGIAIRAGLGPVVSAAAGLSAALLFSGAVNAQDTTVPTADFLFVQTATAMAFDADQSRLTLRGVSPVTLFFSDRPDRIAGNMKTTAFVPFWGEGKDSFLSDPPNADLSIIEDGELQQTVVVLEDPVLDGTDLHYTVKIFDGEMPVTGENVSVFIDIIGMPLTPLSVAGVDRRAFRRAAIR